MMSTNTSGPNPCIQKSAAAPITGPASRLDSLGFLNLILTVETLVNKEFESKIHFASALLEANADRPRTLGDLVDLIVSQLRTSR